MSAVAKIIAKCVADGRFPYERVHVYWKRAVDRELRRLGAEKLIK